MFPGVGHKIKDSPVLNYRDPTLIKTEDILNMNPQTSSSDLSLSYIRPKSNTGLYIICTAFIEVEIK